MPPATPGCGGHGRPLRSSSTTTSLHPQTTSRGCGPSSHCTRHARCRWSVRRLRRLARSGHAARATSARQVCRSPESGTPVAFSAATWRYGGSSSTRLASSMLTCPGVATRPSGSSVRIARSCTTRRSSFGIGGHPSVGNPCSDPVRAGQGDSHGGRQARRALAAVSAPSHQVRRTRPPPRMWTRRHPFARELGACTTWMRTRTHPAAPR